MDRISGFGPVDGGSIPPGLMIVFRKIYKELVINLTMKKKRDPEGYYVISAFISILLTLIIHYFLLSSLNIHTTIHAALAIFIFFIMSALFSALLQRIW